MLNALRNANRLILKLREICDKVVKKCKICKQFKKSDSKPKTTLLKATSLNHWVTFDLISSYWQVELYNNSGHLAMFTYLGKCRIGWTAELMGSKSSSDLFNRQHA